MLLALTVVSSTLLLALTGDRDVLPYLLPTAAAGLLLAVLLDAGVAVARRRPDRGSRGRSSPGRWS